MKTLLFTTTILFLLQTGWSQDKIYVSTYNPTTLFVYSLATHNLTEIPQDTALINTPTFFIIDTIHQRIFQSYRRTNLDTFAIASVNLDGSDRIIIKLDTNYTLDMAIDYEDNKLLWLDNTSHRIMRSNLDGSVVETVLDSAYVHTGLVYNHENNKIYWGDYIGSSTRIYSIDKNGTNKKEILPGVNLGSVSRLAIDYETDKLYWAADEKRKIQRANYDGSMLEDIHIFTGQERPFGLYIDKRKNKLYWTDYGLYKVFRSDLNGANIEEVISQGLNTPLSVFPYYNIINSTENNWSSNDLSLFPNPSKNTIYLNFKNVNGFPNTGSIYSINGKHLYSFEVNTLSTEIPINHLEKGIYILKIQFLNGLVATQKFIKN